MIRVVLCLSLLASVGLPVAAQQTGGYIINGYAHPGNCACNICTQLRERSRPAQPAPQPVTQPAPEPKAAPKSPPPAPKEESAPAVKADSDRTPTTTTTKADIIKSIQDNPNLDPAVKAQILAGLKNEAAPAAEEPPTELVTERPRPAFPVPSPAPKSKAPAFNLLEALSGKKSVKADTDQTPPPSPFLPIGPVAPIPAPKAKAAGAPMAQADRKESFLLMPLGQTEVDPNFELPTTEIGVTVGGKVDYLSSWDIAKAVPNGKLLQFWVKPLTKRPEKLRSVAYNWVVLPRTDYLLWPDTTRVVLSTGVQSQNYVVILTASYVFVDGEQVVQKTAQAITMVQVGEGTTNPMPAAPSLSPVARQAYDWTSLVLRAGDYDDAKVKIDARRLAANFVRIADQIKAGGLPDATAIIRATQAENDRVLTNRNEWLPWFTRMSDALRQGYANNSIRTTAQYEETWREIARGLEAAGN